MTDVVEEEVKDPQGLLKMYRELQADVKTLREENKALTEQVESTDENAVKTWRDRAVKAEAKVQLENQGIKGAERILKYIDLEGVDFDENGALTGLDEKVGVIKTDMPELFDAKKRAGKVDIHENKPPKKEMSSTEAQVARIFK